MTFFYIPLESYRERYTEFLSTENGLWETFLKEKKIKYQTIRPDWATPLPLRIDHGNVLDTWRRSKWALAQTEKIIGMIEENQIQNNDVLFFEDFWHPGFETIPYVRALSKIKFKMYAFCHAQSVDKNDFTYPMRKWMRHFEKGIAASLSGIFVNCPELKQALIGGRINQCPIYTHGHMYNSQMIASQVPRISWSQMNLLWASKRVVYSSRWDSEKNPEFFCRLADQVLKEREDVQFIICTGFKELRSNQPSLVKLAKAMQDRHPKHFLIYTNLSKGSYYAQLQSSYVQFNCASQNWTSYTLLEACTFGASPLYPNYLSFPRALLYSQEHLYKQGDLGDAKKKLYALFDKPIRSDWDYCRKVLKKHDVAIEKMCKTMGVLNM